MKEVVDRILKSEEQARALVDDSQSQAKVIIRQADREAATIVSEQNAKSRADAQALIKKEESRALDEYRKMLQTTRDEASEMKKEKDPLLEQAAAEALKQVMGIE